ncbi:hypothetical protein QBC43DRAFT_357419 [Cladorrhinum sp. PSN259]|nr:hypothetical protein QBC43DRAFT_357419 [Cladorrhinum sp. PSN259]
MASNKQQPSYTMLDLVNIVDTWPYPSSPNYQNHLASYYTLHIAPYPLPIGHLHREFVSRIPWPANLWTISHANRTITLTPLGPSTFESRTEAMRLTLRAGNAAPNPVRSLRRWTGEDFPLFYPPTREIVLKLDGCGVDMLGGINESVFLIAYVKPHAAEQGDEHKLWISRRAAWKSAYPKMWDCTAGGGLAWGETPLDGIVRESWEEVALPKGFIRRGAKYVGENTFQLCRTELGEEGCQLQVQHLFEVELHPLVENDELIKPDPEKAPTEECMEVRLMGVTEVKRRMRDGEMKPGAAMVVLDWMVRWGYVSEETEGKEEFEEIKARLKRGLVIPVVF